YSITGVLLAEYSRSINNEDVQVKDYIYVGGRLLAEYKPAENEKYFYTPDQINSTRVVTDDMGTVVYSAAHDPYGGIQQTWVNTFDPTPKFSGKERDSESGLDYFGARYYDKAQYRFISVDSIRNASHFNPQRTNLYAYCMNNPISYLDPDGRTLIPFNFPAIAVGFYVHQYLDSAFAPYVQDWIDSCAAAGIYLEFTDAYRTPQEHIDLQNKSGSRAAKGWSPHCTGNAVDINWYALTPLQRPIVLACANAAGLFWGGIGHEEHFSSGPSSVVSYSAVQKTYVAYSLYLEYELFCMAEDLSGMDIYIRYGVFTLDAAYYVMWDEINKRDDD
ncbi:MAG: hypothetical protein MIO92_06230, partial [Methanosarcinaceae archaeon]|nr:hypothetical protein [Methanosarcinaceae archaeon]